MTLADGTVKLYDLNKTFERYAKKNKEIEILVLDSSEVFAMEY
jgi:hypothetical protein